MLCESCVWKQAKAVKKAHMAFFSAGPERKPWRCEPARQFPALPWNYRGELLESTVLFPRSELFWFVTLRDVQENWTRKLKIWHVPTGVIGSCIMFVRLQNTSSHEVSKGAKRKQGIVAQSLSGWQSTVFCILYKYMQVYVWDVNKVTFIHHCSSLGGFTSH